MCVLYKVDQIWFVIIFHLNFDRYGAPYLSTYLGKEERFVQHFTTSILYLKIKVILTCMNTYKNTTIKTIFLCWNVLHEKEHLMFILYISYNCITLTVSQVIFQEIISFEEIDL